MKQKKLFVETLGCAMNVRDSEHIVAELQDKEKFELTDNATDADLILINTCSVREKPVSKLFSELGNYNKIKKSGTKIGVCGCSASHLGEEIIRRAPYVNFVLGARNTSKVTEALANDRSVFTDIDYDDSNYLFSDYRGSSLSAFINISVGCDKGCSYCIVPQTRGKEYSIPTHIILKEVTRAVKHGAKEIILLGQNVNNYGVRFSSEHKKTNFTQLLKDVSAISGVERIKFTSPHPLHMDDEFIREFVTNPKIVNSLHMPLQSGSTRVLKEMKRGYSKEQFCDKVEKIRSLDSTIAITTDIIIGYPTEDEKDFKDTLDVIKQAKFGQIFSFIYSPRPLTYAATLKQRVSKEEAVSRMDRLLKLHKEQLDIYAKERDDKICEVFFDDYRKESGVAVGRDFNDFLITVDAPNSILGSTKKVKITNSHRANAHGIVL